MLYLKTSGIVVIGCFLFLPSIKKIGKTRSFEESVFS